MTQEQILEMAKEAGFDVAQWAINGGIEVVIYEEGPITEQLKRFADLVAAHERDRAIEIEDRYDKLTVEFGKKSEEMLAIKKALDIWSEKTDWIQETAQPNEFGVHRADVFKQRIEDAVLKERKACEKACEGKSPYWENCAAAIRARGEK